MSGTFYLLMERDALKARVAELQARNSKLVQILAGIHELLNPPPVEHEGKTYRFVNPDANDVLDELSNRIRAIPDSIDTSMAVIAASKEAP